VLEGPPARLNFAIDVTTTATATVLKVAGEIDAAVSGRLTELLATAVDAGLPVVADLSGVTFCDSTGLTALIHAHRAAEAAGTKFVIATGQRAVLRPLSLLGLTELLEIHPDIATARAAVA
jgi:anti-sigma B factor antagonist